MTSIPAYKKSELFWQAYVVDKSYYVAGNQGRHFRICHKNVCGAPPGGGITMTSFPCLQKPPYLGNHASQIYVLIALLGSPGHSFRIRKINLRRAK